MVLMTVRLLAKTSFTVTLKVLHNISMSVTSIFLVLCFRTSALNIRTFFFLKKVSFFPWHNSPQWARTFHYRSFTITLRHTHTHTHTSRTSLEVWSALRRDLHLTTHNTYNRQISKPPAEFDPAIPANEWPQINALDREATGIGRLKKWWVVNNQWNCYFLTLKALKNNWHLLMLRKRRRCSDYPDNIVPCDVTIVDCKKYEYGSFRIRRHSSVPYWFVCLRFGCNICQYW